MEETAYFNDAERDKLSSQLPKLLRDSRRVIGLDNFRRLRTTLTGAITQGHLARDKRGINPLMHQIDTLSLINEQLGADSNIIISSLLYRLVISEFMTIDDISTQWGDDVASLVKGLTKVSGLYSRQAAVMSDNFRNLLLTFAQDIRVIIIMIVDRLALMRTINHHPDEKYVAYVAYEANYLYAPLAHRLGLYRIKSELEDLSLKYTHRDIYTRIARDLNATKARRDAYIADFIAPVKQKLADAGLKFDIKGRTKSIYSIWNKIKKQNNDLEHIYDLFAIRIIIDAPPAKEKSDCWLAYSVVTDMYTPNPARMKDWISIPKSNGYESLHITVKGPENKWEEVQIRTRRMDLVAEKGFAAHWKYKGLKSEGDLDTWMNNVRDILETADSGPMELMKDMKMDIYNKEVFVFTPRGDLHRLPLGATLLDFAFSIHSRLGCQCTGGVVNGKHRKLNYKLQSGDTVEIATSTTQAPKQDWLNIAITNKARNKIRQSLNERSRQAAELGKELLQRRFKNRKIDIDEATLMRVIKRLGFKTVTDFYNAIADEKLEVNDVIAEYDIQVHKDENAGAETRSAEEYTLMTPPADTTAAKTDDVIVIGDNIKGINYRLSKCCNPIYGDNVFGFISAEGVIKIHRDDCPNAHNIRTRYPYRIIRTRWSGTIGQQFGATLRIVGNDDLGIVTNITSIIAKEKGAYLRNIAIDSDDGIFRGFLVVGVETTETLDRLIKKIKTVKGVKDVQRSV